MSDRRTSEVVVVTGGGAGLGRAIVQSFARRGAHLCLVSRGSDRLEDARAEVERLGGRAITLVGDVADPATTEEAAARTEAAFGPIDVWVNDAMTTIFSPVAKTSPEDFRRVTEVTYLGFVYGTMAALKRMRPRDHGTIVQVGSALAYRSIPLQAAYCGAKHGMVGFTDSLRTELIHDRSGVWVTVVHMPGLNTPQFSWCKTNMPRQAQPVPPIYQPEVGAEAVYWAAHHRHREVFVGWPTVQAIWGQRLIPGILDHYLAHTAWEGQMVDGAVGRDHPFNLYTPVPGHESAHGIFDARAHASSLEMALTTRSSWVATALSSLVGVVMARMWGQRPPVPSSHLGDGGRAVQSPSAAPARP